MTTPSLHRVSSHTYDLLSDIDGLVTFLDTLFTPLPGKHAGDLYRARWRHGNTLLILFDGDPPRLAVMGAPVEEVDDLALEVVE